MPAKTAKPDTPAEHAPVKRGRGQPPKEISLAEVVKLRNVGCTDEEIASILGVHVHTLQARKRDPEFLAAYEKGWNEGKVSLRRAQLRLAQKGNATMQIWLGKQILGQVDKQEHTGANGGPIDVSVTWAGLYAKAREYRSQTSAADTAPEAADPEAGA